MSDEQNTAAAPAGRTATWIIAVAFAILYAGPLFWAVSDLVEYPAQVGGRTPWWLLIVAVAIPVALYVGGCSSAERAPRAAHHPAGRGALRRERAHHRRDRARPVPALRRGSVARRTGPARRSGHPARPGRLASPLSPT
ncbi:hypothetical protein GCM10025881_09630 [Pseudolysinimonas kribbensis]|uniref:Uncharacterized protein n=1 Tax=Pseudolysinimonas kribbensis TaxID=433641 RepID=A0ABQ6K1F7_9MICO|nr:hypothetical protein GCM10025881_09630 [Pseudolysinimonas kribbensis]